MKDKHLKIDMVINILWKKYLLEKIMSIRYLKRQGLFFYNNILYESGGHYKKSTLLKRTLENNYSEPFDIQKINDKYFGEGCDFYVDEQGVEYIYQLTWRERKIIEYKNGQLFREFQLPSQIREGWGITHDPNQPNIFYMTDGTQYIYVTDRNQDFKMVYKNKKVYHLNELEFIDGNIWANIYFSNDIVIIDPKVLTPLKRINFVQITSYAYFIMRQLNGRNLANDEVLNGIAYNPNSGKIVLTGKHWPALFQIKADIDF